MRRRNKKAKDQEENDKMVLDYDCIKNRSVTRNFLD